MGASIHYRFVNDKNPRLPVNAPSNFLEAMERAFGSRPFTITEERLGVINGLAAGMPHERETWEKIAILVSDEGPIEIWPEW